jgi:amino acid adenylation domain-containing protein
MTEVTEPVAHNQRDNTAGLSRDQRKNIEAVYPLSPMQQGMLFHSLYAPESGAYFEQFSAVLRGDLDVSAFERAWREVVKRQAVLRTAFVWKRLDRMLQVVQKEVDLPVAYYDWRTVDRPAIEDKIQAYIAADRAQGFDLAKPPLMRLALMRIEDNAHLFIWSNHHALMDGWSMPLLLKEVLTFYESFSQSETPYLQPSRPYRDYISWLQQQDQAAAQAYWSHTLHGMTAPTSLVVDHPTGGRRLRDMTGEPGAERHPDGQSIHPFQEIIFSKDSTTRLATLARRERLTLSTLIQAAWALLLSRYTGEQDVMFGATVAGRPADLAGAENMIGLFINTLPVRVNVPLEATLASWLQQLQAQSVETRQYEYTSLVQIQEWSEIPKGFPLFESILVFENYPVENTLKQQMGSGRRLSVEDVRSYEQTNYPLTIVSGPGERLGIKISYDAARFDQPTIVRMLGHLKTLLEGMVDGVDQPAFQHRKLIDLPMLTAEEEKQLLEDFVENTIVHPDQFVKVVGSIPGFVSTAPNIDRLTIPILFKRQAARAPDSIALICEESQIEGEPGKNYPKGAMTYSELDQRSDALARFLISLGVRADVLVGMFMERSVEMIVGILGILKARGAYLPLDPTYPLERIAFMLEDTRAPVVLTQAHLSDLLSRVKSVEFSQSGDDSQLKATQRRIVLMDEDWEEIARTASIIEHTSVENESVENSQDPLTSDPSHDLAYVIYTSGSTGKPKGVMIEHHSLVNHALNFAALNELSATDRVLQFISFGFDASAEEIFPTLISGATLVLPGSSRELTTTDFCNLVERQSISILHLPVAFWHQCVDDMAAESLSVPKSVRVLVVGGESPSIDKLKSWVRMAGNRANHHPGDFPSQTTFINAYGPTESTIAASYFKCLFSVESAAAMSELSGESHRYHLNDLDNLERLPIGRGLVNNQIYILDQALHPVPIGVPGEICIGGEGVARGYLNREAITAEKFIVNPFHLADSQIPNLGNADMFRADHRLYHRLYRRLYRLLYRTGDLGRYLPDGNIEFLGRVDQQVKIRGFRIELGEIEAVLSLHPQVQSAAVLAREEAPGKKSLVAYVVPGNGLGSVEYNPVEYNQSELPANEVEIGLISSKGDGGAVSADELRSYLRNNLPDYMVPAVFVMLDRMPLTPNGKIDRRALPAPDGLQAELSSAYVAPRNPVEGLIAGVWEQVLGLARVGIYDNFFDLGGHSLIATQVISRLRNVFQIDVPLKDLFETPNVAGLATQIEAALKGEIGIAQPVIEPIERVAGSDLPLEPPQLSFSQQRLWFLDQLAPGNLFYNIPLAVEIQGKLDAAALQKTLNEIVARHAVLRTNFKTIGGTPVQIVRAELNVELPFIDLTGLAEQEQKIEAKRLAQEEARLTFNLQSDPLIRARLLRLGAAGPHQGEKHVFLLTMHHIVSDGWSMGVFLKEIVALYEAYSTGKPSPLPDLKIQYFDFAHWQRNWLQGEQLERQLDYWKKQLTNQSRFLDLPTDHPRPAIQSSRGATQSFEFSGDLSEKLNELSRREGATLFMTLLAGFQVLLYRYSGQEDISVGTAIANRNHSEIENLIGFFVNTLVMRTDLSGEPNFKALLKRVRDTSLGAYAHQDLPFETLVEALQPDRNLSHTPLFQVAFALQSSVLSQRPNSEDLNRGGLAFNPIEVDSGTAKFDITLSLAETPDGLAGALEYNRDLFEPDTIQQMIEHFRILLEGIVADPDQSVATLQLLSKTEQQVLLVDWNASEMDTPVDRCAHQLFEARVNEQPDVEAVRLEEIALTYRELDRRANQLAHYLRTLGVRPDVLVGISTERSFEMVTGILGVMKAGGAYVPLDPTYPSERLAYMIRDSEVPVLLTQQRLLERLPIQGSGESGATDSTQLSTTQLSTTQLSAKMHIVCLDTDWPEIEKYPTNRVVSNVAPDNLAYMIYTSGSTGRPKGTLLRHRGLSNLTEAQRRAFGITENSRILQFSPLSFDASVWETFMALANGATLVLARQETLASGPDLLRYLKDQAITTATLPPSVLRLYTAEQVSRQGLPSLQTVISAGEACTPELVANWSPGRDFFNAYGPTETTVCASMYHCTGAETMQPPIGEPIANTKLYILDKHLQLVPVGVPGELHVAGVSLAVGYRNQPEMTALKFIENPFRTAGPDISDRSNQAQPGTTSLYPTRRVDRLYKTGDLVRYQRNGNIEFLGRVDQQVKVRGFRIELGEIESALGGYERLKEGVVVTQDAGAGDKRLVAFVVPNPGEALEVNELRSFLRKVLPEYMIPSAFLILEELPLSPSGKVDRKALAAMRDFDRPELKSEYIAPRNDIERRLAAISSELLHLDKVGIYDNFFELGGHSLLATQFVSRVRDEYGIEFPLRKLFESPTISAIAETITSVEYNSIGYNQEQQTANRMKSEIVDDNVRADISKTNKAADRAKLLEMLHKIGELSPEEAKAMLEQLKQADS